MQRSFQHVLMFTVAALALSACETMDMGSTTQQTQQTITTTVSTTAAPGMAAPVTGTVSETVVGRQIQQLRSDLIRLQNDVSNHGAELSALRSENQNVAAEYYTAVGEISAKLQAGSTRGNPRLVARWQDASSALERLAANVSNMNSLSSKIASSASMSNYLLESTRATYGLSGAVEEDHQQLDILQDDVQRSVVQIERVSTDLTRDVERQNNYVAGERRNLQTLSLAINQGELYSNNLANLASRPAPAMNADPAALNAIRPMNAMPRMPAAHIPTASLSPLPSSEKFRPSAAAALPPEVVAVPKKTGVLGQLPASVEPPKTMTTVTTTTKLDTPVAKPVVRSDKPFVIIRFDRPDVDYGQPLYQAMSQALEKNPEGSFEVMAVTPSGTDAQHEVAQNTIRRKAEDVMRTMSQMGVPADRMSLQTADKADAKTPEVHIFLR